MGVAGTLKHWVNDTTWGYSLFASLVFAAAFALAFLLTNGLCGAVFSILAGTAIGLLALCFFSQNVASQQHNVEGSPFMSKCKNAGVYYIALAGLLALIGISMTYLYLGLYPFGVRTVLIVDMHHQYVAFFASLRDRITSGQSMLYSTSTGLGSNYISLFAYYISSPFNIILLLFPRESITEAIALMTVLKIASAAISFAVFMRIVFNKRDYTVPILSVCYALMSFFIVHSWNLMWLDSIVLLPLVVAGLEQLLRGKGLGTPLLYCITLSMALITNYYIGYMICIYLVLYFIARMSEDDDNSAYASRKEAFLARLGRFGRFAYASLLSGGIAAIVLVPTALALGQTSGASDEFARDLASYFDLFEIYSRAMFSASPSIRGDSLPNIYCSVLAVFLVILFFLNRKIPLAKRISLGVLLGFMVVTASINWTYFAWHGFHFPNDLPHRFSFLISFTLLLIAAHTLSELKGITRRNVLVAFAIAVAGLVITEFVGTEEATFTLIYVSLGFFVLYAIPLFAAAAGKIKMRNAVIVLLITVFIEVTANACVTITTMDNNEHYTWREDFVTDYTVNEQALEIIDGYNTPQYRTEILPRKTCNDPSLFGYSGLTVFASSNPESVIDMMGRFGFANNGVNSHMYKTYVPLRDSILNLRFLVFNRDLGVQSHLTALDATTDGTESRYIYLNPDALSRGFVVDNEFADNWDAYSVNPFEVQNSFVTAATGLPGVYDTVTASDISSANCHTEFPLSDDLELAQKGCYFLSSINDGVSNASFTATYTFTEKKRAYIYIDCRAATSITVSNGTNTWSSSITEPYIIDLSTVGPDSPVKVTIGTQMTTVGNIFLVTMDEERYAAAMQALSSQQWIVDTYSQTHLSGEVSAADAGTFFTSIPYDKGWTVKVDGKEVDTFALGEAFISFYIPEGTHTVDMRYNPPGFAAGIAITVVCLFALVAVMFLRSRKGRELISRLLPSRKAVAVTTESRPRVITARTESVAGFKESNDGFDLDFDEEEPDESDPLDGLM